MDLFNVAIACAAGSFLMLASAFLWLARRKRFRAREMSKAEAGHFAARAGRREQPTATWVGGTARGAEWTAHISNDQLMRLVRAGEWRQAAPWLLLGGGVVGAFSSWPFLVLQLIGVNGRLAALVGMVLLLVAIRTAWPREQGQ